MELADTADALKLDDTEDAVVDLKNDRPTRPLRLPPRTPHGLDLKVAEYHWCKYPT
jgi:hypothetical protein